jgi:peptidoglycan/xylan/chitin deacetylase (PgdA/CDA1 family)
MLAIEHFVWGEPGTTLQPLLTAHPEVANWAWRDYGNRVGVWRLFDHLALTGRLPGPELARAVIDHFDQLWRDGETHGRSMAIGIHSFISGQALRTRYVREYLEHMKARGEVWLTTSDAIYDWMASPSVP